MDGIWSHASWKTNFRKTSSAKNAKLQLASVIYLPDSKTLVQHRTLTTFSYLFQHTIYLSFYSWWREFSSWEGDHTFSLEHGTAGTTLPAMLGEPA